MAACPLTGQLGRTGVRNHGWWRCRERDTRFLFTLFSLSQPPPSSWIRILPSPSRGELWSRRFNLFTTRVRWSLCPLLRGYYSHMFVVTKVSGGWRPIIDLSTLNLSVVVSKFLMETAQSVLHSVRRGDWMVSIDLKDAYLQVPIHP